MHGEGNILDILGLISDSVGSRELQRGKTGWYRSPPDMALRYHNLLLLKSSSRRVFSLSIENLAGSRREGVTLLFFSIDS